MFMPTDRHLQVTLYNAWGGAAHGVVGEHRQAASPVQEWPKWWVVWAFGAPMVMAYVLYRRMEGGRTP